jgi:hypothetical protein
MADLKNIILTQKNKNMVQTVLQKENYLSVLTCAPLKLCLQGMAMKWQIYSVKEELIEDLALALGVGVLLITKRALNKQIKIEGND